MAHSPVVIQGNSGTPLTNYVGERGELVMDYNAKVLRLHDGATSGGIVFQASTVTPLSGAATTSDIITAFNGLITIMQTARLMT